MHTDAPIPYARISFFSTLLLAAVTWGFYKTYLIFFPSFDGFHPIHHIHGALMMYWILMLIVQPLLILKGKIRLHRLLGKISFVVVPLLALSIVMVTRQAYIRPIPGMTPEAKIAEIALSFPLAPAFLVLYLLAILNKRNTYNHMRYMVGTSLLMIGPSVGRGLMVFFGKTLDQSVDITDFLSIGIAAALMIFDISQKRSWKANAIILLTMVLLHVIWESRDTAAWQATGSFIARMLF